MLGLRAFKVTRTCKFRHHALSTRCRDFSGGSTRRANGKGTGTIFSHLQSNQRLQTLAIETSCDDTSVAILSVSRLAESSKLRTEVVFHDKVTAKTEAYNGIHPLVALESHQSELAKLVQRALSSTSTSKFEFRPDFVTVTRGPGMRSNLSVGLDTAKGLALAWAVPLLGVHHMQAHALTPRLCSTIDLGEGTGQALQFDEGTKTMVWDMNKLQPKFPFLSVLASGGHTMLIDSQSLTEHKILAETADIALGDFLDKAARAILTNDELKAPYGKALEDFAFPTGNFSDYTPPARRQEELERRSTPWGWGLSPPFADSKGGEKSSRRMAYSFSGLLTVVQRLAADIRVRSVEERRDLAREVQRIAFEHLCSRILLHLSSHSKHQQSQISTVVVSGGVAANKFLRHILRSILDVRGYRNIDVYFPPVELCTDNALMIAWAGLEMWNAGYESDLSIRPIRKWSMDSSSDDGGILGVGGWSSRNPD